MEKKLILTNDGSHTLFVPEINECYHSRHGAIVEAEHVFIKTGFSTLKKSKLNILEIGFGTGLNTLLTYQKAEQRSIKVNYHTIEPHPINKENYIQLNFANLIGLEQKNLLDLHNCPWEEASNINNYFTLIKHRITLEKYNTDIKFDIIYFDAFSPNKQPELWSQIIFEKIYNFLKENGSLVTYCAKGSVKRTMESVGFKIVVLDGPPGKRQMTRGEKLMIKR